MRKDYGLKKSDVLGQKCPSIFICSPTYTGDVSCHFLVSLLQTTELLKAKNVKYEIYFSVNDSLVARARNDLADKFLKSNCTHVLMIDSDQGWTPAAVPKMLDFNKDFITGAVVSRKPNCEEYALTIKTDEYRIPIVDSDGLLQCGANGVAFALIKRKVFEDIKNVNPSSHNPYPYFQHKYFDNGDHYGEDTYFVKQWQGIGDVYLYPDITFKHGTNEANYHKFLLNCPRK